jgi:threonine/homoserine/homoserine lactone efflux protein
MSFPVDWVTLLTFVPAALALNLTPGADMMFCLGQGIRGGWRAAIAADLGIVLGGMVHVTVAGLGLGALVASYPWVFDAIRWMGVAYLLWLAWGAFTGLGLAASGAMIKPGRAFWQALIVSLTNPKVILFVLAFIPQFVDPARAPVLEQFLIFGAVLCLGGLLINGLVGVFAGGLGSRMARSPRLARGLGLASGGIFAGLAVRLALLERS